MQYKVAIPSDYRGQLPDNVDWVEAGREVAIHFDEMPGCCGANILHFLTGPYGLTFESEHMKEDVYLRLLHRLTRERNRVSAWMLWIVDADRPSDAWDSQEARMWPTNMLSIYEFLRISSNYGLNRERMGDSWENDGSGNMMQGYRIHLPEWFAVNHGFMDRSSTDGLPNEMLRIINETGDIGYVARRNKEGNWVRL